MSQSDYPVVSIVRASEYNSTDALMEPVREACELIGGLVSLIMPGDTVLLKPNLVRPLPYTTGGTTNPYLIEALAELCKEAGARKIVIADGSCIGADTQEAFDVTGLTDIANRHGYELVDFIKAPFVYVANPLAKKMKRIRIPKQFLEANVVIDVPVMKTHDALEVSLGLKNMKGVLQSDDKKRFHKWGLAQSIVDLNQIVRPDLTIIDATVAMEGSGPTAGDPVGLGLLLASKDVVAVDRVACEIMGFSPDEVPYIKLAAESGLGCDDISEIEIEGLSLEEVRRPFLRNSINPAELEKYGIVCINQDACSGCANAVASFLVYLSRRGALEDMRDTVLLYGQSVEELPPELVEGKRIIRVGSCTRKLRDYGHYFPGCPPYPYSMLSDLGLNE